MENKTIWEEKSYTEHERNYLNKEKSEINDTETTTQQKSTNGGEHGIISGVYVILNKVNNKCYVGSAKNIIKNRWPHHRYSLRKNKHHCCALQRAWNKYGEENFEFRIMETCDKNRLTEREQHYINTAKSVNRRNCYNTLDIAGRPPDVTGTKQTKEHTAKIVAFHTGRKRSIETCKNISKSKLGIKLSIQTRKKMSNSRIGKLNPRYGERCSPETKNKIRDSKHKSFLKKIENLNIDKNSLHWILWNYPQPQICKVYNIKQNTLNKLCKFYGLNKIPKGYWRSTSIIDYQI